MHRVSQLAGRSDADMEAQRVVPVRAAHSKQE